MKLIKLVTCSNLTAWIQSFAYISVRLFWCEILTLQETKEGAFSQKKNLSNCLSLFNWNSRSEVILRKQKKAQITFIEKQESPPAWTQEAYRPPCSDPPPPLAGPDPPWLDLIPPGWPWPPLAESADWPPPWQTDRHVSKHNLPIILCTRAVNM